LHYVQSFLINTNILVSIASLEWSFITYLLSLPFLELAKLVTQKGHSGKCSRVVEVRVVTAAVALRGQLKRYREWLGKK
jgi:hypothetical protein